MTTITSVTAREVLDSRGRPTVEADVELSDGTVASASVPSGASTGRHEARELRDGDMERYRGRGVLRAVDNVRTLIAPTVCGLDADFALVDERMISLDATEDKSHLGANATLAVSLAAARAQATSEGVELWEVFAGDMAPELPLPMVNILSGGLHAGRQIEFQDFLAVPVGANTYREALRWVVGIHEAMGDVLRERSLSTLKADEGGYGPAIAGSIEALELMDAAVQRAGFLPGRDVVYALDVAATHFFDPSTRRYRIGGTDRTSAELVEMLAGLAERFAIASIEDGLAEDDWDGWAELTARLGDGVQLIGDDLFTTNIARVRRGVVDRSANAVLVKMNQIGTLSETLAVVREAKDAGWRTVISARSGETEDSALADLALGCDGGQIKVGSVTQSERLAKYNRLLRLEEALGSAARLARPFAARGQGVRA